MYESYGRILNQNGSGTTSEGKTLFSENPFKYASYFHDQETNYYYLMARYYIGSQGRFLTADSSPDTNLYAYVDNDPVNNVDPNGDSWIRKSWSFVKEASGYNDVKRAIKNPSPLNIAKAVKAAKAAKQLKSKKKVVACKIRCFVAGTLIQTEEGLKKVEDIEVGDLVLSKNDETGDVAYKEVEETFTRVAPEIYTIVAGTESYGVTGEHPFWVVGQGWVETENLNIGDLLTDKNGKEIIIRDIFKEEKETPVYNFSVSDYHTYFVGEQAIWTHNCPDGDGSYTITFESGMKYHGKGYTTATKYIDIY